MLSTSQATNIWGCSELPTTSSHGETLRMLPTALGPEWVPPCQGCRERKTHLHHLLCQDRVAGRILSQERGGDLLTVLQGLGWEPMVSQARGVEELVHLGRGKQSRS